MASAASVGADGLIVTIIATIETGHAARMRSGRTRPTASGATR